ncbi:hypothetical protein Tco_0912500 [Tanacetum coccineum]
MAPSKMEGIVRQLQEFSKSRISYDLAFRGGAPKERVKPRRRQRAIGYDQSVWSKEAMILAAQKSNSIGPEIVQETTDKVVSIKEKFKAVRYRQKSYAGNRRKPLEFEVGRVSVVKGVRHGRADMFRVEGKLVTEYVRTV